MVAGIALHCLVPAYGLTLIGDALLGDAPASWAQWLPHALALGGRFLVAYGLASAGLTLLAALVERVAPGQGRQRAEVEQFSQAALLHGLARAQGCLGAQGDMLLDRVSALSLDLDDSPTRDMLRDLLRLLEAVQAVSGPDGVTQQRSLTALETLVEALEDKARDNAMAASDKVETLAHYVAAKYGEKID